MRQNSSIRALAQAKAGLLYGTALGRLALGQGAFAQSSLTIFGVVDAAVSRVNGSERGNRIGLSSGGNAGSRLGFRGTEDLGGGLFAGYWLEGSLGVDTGTANGLMFNRRSTVSLSGGWGELRLGRDYAPTYWSVTRFDPFNRVGVANHQGVNNFGVATVQNSNAVGYVLPKLGGWYGQAQYGFGEKSSTAANPHQGDYFGARLGYASGPLDIALAAGRYRQVVGASDTPSAAIGRNLEISNLAASWNFGLLKPIVFLGRERVPGAAPGARQLDTYMAAMTASVWAGEFRLSLARYDRKDSSNDFTKLGIGYGYEASKRTELYANLAYLKNNAASAESLASTGLTRTGVRSGGNSSGFDFGIRHSY